MKRIYIAGALGGNHIQYIRNLHRMVYYANSLMRRGYSVFVPGLDFLQAFFDG